MLLLKKGAQVLVWVRCSASLWLKGRGGGIVDGDSVGCFVFDLEVEVASGEPDGTTKGGDNGTNISKQKLFLLNSPLGGDMHIDKDKNKILRDAEDTQASTIKESRAKHKGEMTRP